MCHAVLLSGRKQAAMLATSAYLAALTGALAAGEDSRMLAYVPLCWVQVRVWGCTMFGAWGLLGWVGRACCGRRGHARVGVRAAVLWLAGQCRFGLRSVKWGGEHWRRVLLRISQSLNSPILTPPLPSPHLLNLQAPLQLLDALHGANSPFAASAAPVPPHQMHAFITFVVRLLGNSRVAHPGEALRGLGRHASRYNRHKPL